MVEDSFLTRMAHAPCSEENIESADYCGYLIDDSGGLSQHLDFPSGVLSNVDYFCKKDHAIQLIEFSDLSDSISQCSINLDQMLLEAEEQKGEPLTSREAKSIRKKAWALLTSEFRRKWNGSIAVMERLYRKNSIIDDNPEYCLLIVCKNGTEVRLQSLLKDRLTGTMRNVAICTTENIDTHLLDKIEN